MFPFHRETLLQHRMVYNHAWPLSSPGMSTNKLKLNPHKTEFILIGNEPQQIRYLSMFPTKLVCVKTHPAKSAWNLGVILG